jgi:ribosomal protein S18 acetylase RimI-like enzyme
MIQLRHLQAADLPLGLRLCRQAGWNQTERDWLRFLDLQPDGCFVAEWDGVPVGTTCAFLFGPVAWIAMVLVEESHRGRGIGRALMRHALDDLDRRGIASVRLDATPLGQPLYESLGFVEQFRLARYEGILPGAPAVAGITTASAQQWEALAALDEQSCGADRRRLLFRLFNEQPDEVRVVRAGDGLDGFLTLRRGYRATQLGPCIASATAGPLLFADAWQRQAGQRVYIDIPLVHEAARRLAEAQGLVVQRMLMRMCRGVPRCERVESLWASSGPEKG